MCRTPPAAVTAVAHRHPSAAARQRHHLHLPSSLASAASAQLDKKGEYVKVVRTAFARLEAGTATTIN